MGAADSVAPLPAATAGREIRGFVMLDQAQCNATHRPLLPLSVAAAWWRDHRDDCDADLARHLLRHGEVALGDDPGRFALVTTIRLELARRGRSVVRE